MLIILGIGLYLMYQRGEGAPHIMSPTGVAVTILLALMIDFAALGPGRFADKVAFLLATVAIREGLDGSPIDQKTTGWVHDWIQRGLDSEVMIGSYLSMADVNIIMGFLIGIAWIYALLCLLPGRWFNKKLGRAVNLQFPASKQMRINPSVWALAFILGIGADMPAGAVGIACRGSIDILTGPIAMAVTWLFGA